MLVSIENFKDGGILKCTSDGIVESENELNHN